VSHFGQPLASSHARFATLAMEIGHMCADRLRDPGHTNSCI
jgi:hypothetical protein